MCVFARVVFICYPFFLSCVLLSSKTVLLFACHNRLTATFSGLKLGQGGSTARRGTAVTVVLSRFIPVSGLSSPLVFADALWGRSK